MSIELCLALLVFVIPAPTVAEVTPRLPDQLEGVGVTEKVGTGIPRELRFRNHEGRPVSLGMILGERPVVLSLNYSRCPLLCQLQLQGLVDSLRRIDLNPGQDFDIVSVSIDPLETPQQASTARQRHLRAYGVPGAGNGWHFLTGERQSIRAIADAAGFEYRYLPEQKEYAHAAVMMIVTPDGLLSHYFYGVQYDPPALRLALIESSQGQLGSAFDQLLLFCLHYDAEAGRYGPVARNIMSLGGALTVILLSLWLVPAWLRRLNSGRQRQTVSAEKDCLTSRCTQRRQVLAPSLMLPLSAAWFPESASTVASDVDGLFWFITVICTVFFLLIVGLMTFFVIRYRRTGQRQTGSGPSHNTRLEVLWSVVPGILLMLIFAYGAKGFVEMGTPPENTYEIKVTAKMWSWSFRYPNGHVDNELHVPAGRPVRLVMNSDDVIHSLFVPAFRLKQDVIPGRYTRLWFEATQVGQFPLFCAEYCGQKHSDMVANVVVHRSGEFERWLETAANLLNTLPPSEAGKILYTRRGCAQCHSTDGSRRVGPSFYKLFSSRQRMTTGRTVIVDENYVRESILEPQAKVREGFRPVMPTYQGQLKDAEIDALIEYIKTLR